MEWNLDVREWIECFMFAIIMVHQWTQNDPLAEKVWNGRNLLITVDFFNFNFYNYKAENVHPVGNKSCAEGCDGPSLVSHSPGIVK